MAARIVPDPERQWKFLHEDGGIRSQHGGGVWTLGKWRSLAPSQLPPLLCQRGFHASPTIAEALAYVGGDVIAQVETAGTTVPAPPSLGEARKSAHGRMRLVTGWRVNDAFVTAVRHSLYEMWGLMLDGKPASFARLSGTRSEQMIYLAYLLGMYSLTAATRFDVIDAALQAALPGCELIGSLP